MENRLSSIFLFAILLAAALNLAHAGYREQAEIRVLSQDGYPVPGAQVWVKYEITHSRGNFTTGPKTTNENGRVNFDFSNSEYIEEDTNKEYAVIAKFGPSQGTGTFTANFGEYPRTVRVEAYTLNVHVVDRDERPISVPVRMDELEKNSDAWGNVRFIVPKGNHTVSAIYRGVERSAKITIEGHLNTTLAVKLYNLSVHIADDTGKPIAADIYVGSQQKAADAEGNAFFDDILDPKPTVSIYLGRFRKAAAVDLDLQDSLSVYFDTHPPIISNVEAQYKDNFLQVRAIVDENATHASGLKGSQASVRLSYKAISGTDRDVPMYVIGYNFYEGLIPVTGTEAQIKYTVVATDADGNRKISTDTFVIPTSPRGPSTNRGEPPAPINSLSQPDTNLLLLVGIGILAIVVGVTLHYYHERGVGGYIQLGQDDKGKKPPAGAEPPKGPNIGGAGVSSAKPASPPAVPPSVPGKK